MAEPFKLEELSPNAILLCWTDLQGKLHQEPILRDKAKARVEKLLEAGIAGSKIFLWGRIGVTFHTTVTIPHL